MSQPQTSVQNSVNSPHWTPAAFVVVLVGALSLLPFVTAAEGLVAGVIVALAFGNPLIDQTKKITHRLLSLSVMGLGFGMNLYVVGKVGFQGVGYTVIGITFALIFGTVLGRIYRIDRDTSLLITVGTAICGGSAIAAVAPVIRAKSHETSVALGTIFLLNALALILFPMIGHHFALTETQFGLWSALAIHDTSSVVGAASQYGPHALEVGTTVKLARALWIVPVTLAIGFVRSREKMESTEERGTFKKPWFILGFILAAAVVTFFPALQSAGHIVESMAKRALVLTLFLIGAGMTRKTIQAVGFRPFLQGVTLWIVVAVSTLGAILAGWIH